MIFKKIFFSKICLWSGLIVLPTGLLAMGSDTKAMDENTTKEAIVVTASPLPRYRVESITSGTLVGMTPEEAPFVVDTFTEDFIRERNVNDLDQLLTLQPGIYQGGKTMMSRNVGTYNIRGFGGSEVMMGGVPLTGGIGTFLDPTLLEGVDIVKGPVGGAYGGQNTSGDALGGGGAILLRPKRPSFEESFWELGVRASTSRQSGHSLKMTSDANYVNEEEVYAVRVPLAYSWRDPGWAPKGAGYGRVYSAAPSVTWKVNENLEMGVDLFYQYSNQPAYQGIRVKYGKPTDGMGWDDTYTRPEDRMRFQVHGGTFRIDGRVNDLLSLRTRASFFQSQYRYSYLGPASGTTINPAIPLSRYEPAAGDSITRNWYLSQEAIFEFETGPVEHTFLAGTDLTVRERTGWGFFGWAKKGRNTLYGVLPETTTNDTMQKKVGINLQEVAKWKGLTFLLGARADWHNSVRHQHQWVFNPRAGISYDLLEEGWLILFANISQTKNPNFNLKRYIPGVASHNIYLDSTWKALQKEVGFRINPVGSLWLTTTAFRIDQSGAPLGYPNQNSEYYIDEGKTYSQGFEFSASGDITDNWSAYIAYAYIDYYDKMEGERFDRYPPHAASFWTSYKCESLGGMVFGLGGRWRHDWLMTMRGKPAGEEYRTKSLLTFDASVDFPITETFSCGFAVRNIFNSRGVESARNLQAFANDARTFELSFKWRF